VDKPSQAVRSHLQQNLKGQERAVEAVVGAIEAWEFSCVPQREDTSALELPLNCELLSAA